MNFFELTLPIYKPLGEEKVAQEKGYYKEFDEV
jgi:hypothetical protein